MRKIAASFADMFRRKATKHGRTVAPAQPLEETSARETAPATTPQVIEAGREAIKKASPAKEKKVGAAKRQKKAARSIPSRRGSIAGDQTIAVFVTFVGLITAALTAGVVYFSADELYSKYVRSEALERATFAAGRLQETGLQDRDGSISAEENVALKTILAMPDVFRIEVFNRAGERIRELSDATGGTDIAPIGRDEARSLIEAGEGALSWQDRHAEEGAGPSYYSRTLVPIEDADGNADGAIAVYLDHSADEAGFWQWLTGILGTILVLALVAFTIPAVSLLLRTRQKREVYEELTYVSGHDTLTGLSNRDEFLRTLEVEIRRQSEEGHHLALHYIDIDRFKEINDTHGHAAGDEFLKQVAERLRDVVEKPQYLARLGGDEFAIIQLEAGGTKYAEIHARRIGSALNGVYKVGDGENNEVVASASIGIAVSPEHGENANELLKNADLALNKVKAGGRNDISVFTTELTTSMQGRLEMQAILRKAFREKWFVLYFQPQYDLVTRRLTGFEALLRLKHPERGVVSPTEFIPVAEETGLIEPIGEWILKESCRAASLWPEHLTLAVNLSPAQFKKGNLPRLIAKTLKQTGLKADRLEVEITEGLLLETSNRVLSQLREIKKMGAALIMDDFGTGYSSLSYLWRFSFDGIKIDRSFVHGVGVGGQVEKLLRSIIRLGISLDLKVIAEGVESAQQAHFLVANDCRNVQGFLFGWPVPKDEVATVIAKDIRVGTRAAQKRHDAKMIEAQEAGNESANAQAPDEGVRKSRNAA